MAPELESLLRELPRVHVRQASPLGLVLSADLDAGSWSALVASVAQLVGRVSRHWETATAWLGDLLAFGHGKYRGQITAYAEAAGLDPGPLRVAKLVCCRIPVLSRHNALSWSHHCEVGRAESYLEKCVAALPADKREAARAAFAEISDTGADCYLSKLLAVLEANNT